MAQIFERKPCGRCGGSGKYSYNQMHGDRCYGCGGSGVVLTARGKAAQAHMIALQTRSVSDVKAGEFVWYDPFPFGGKTGWVRVGEVRDDTLNAGHVMFELFRGDRQLCSYGTYKTGTIRSVRDQAHLNETQESARAYQATLNANGKQSKRAPATA